MEMEKEKKRGKRNALDGILRAARSFEIRLIAV